MYTLRKSVSRRQFLSLSGSALAAGALTSGAAHPKRRPNIIYAFSDEHRYQSMGFTELPGVKTPNMNRMAEEGVSFTHCISNYPVCSPYRAILMSGRWPYQQGIIDNNIPLSPDQMTLGKAFRNAGYRTAYVGKWHLGGTRAEAFGFDTSLIWTQTNKHWDKSSYHPAEGGPVKPKGYNATLMTDQALAFIGEKPDEPFFVMLSWNPPHASFTDPPKEKLSLYPKGSLGFRPNYTLETKDAEGRARIWRQNDWEHYRGYHAHVSAIDDELGRLMTYLDEKGLAENTILVYTSDHGSMFGSHGVGSKRQPYEESIRVPFMVRHPGGLPAGLSSDVLFGAIDIMPTLCGLAGLGIPGSCQGQDFSPVMHGNPGPDPESQFIMHISKLNASGGNNHPAPWFRGVRTRKYTYAVYPDRPWCLFDNEADPYQMNNLIGDPDMREVRERLHAMTADWLKRTEDPFEMPVLTAGT